jgi:ATP-binding cassette subfamily F protein 3
MAILSAERLTKRFGAELVLVDVSLQVSRGDRIALIGPNGCGKSTLLKLLIGLEEPNDGRIQRAGSARIGYLPQEPRLAGDVGLYKAMVEAKRELRDMEREMRSLEAELTERGDDTDLLHRYDELLERYHAAGGYEYESEIHKVLAGLGFSSEDERKPLAHLSGGERARAALARLLLEEPEVLLLDEPTNHLDLQALEWLEEYLFQWKGGFVIASHDRFLIDRLATRIWELEHGHLTEYPGNYSKYLVLKHERVERRQKLYEEQKKLIEKMEDFIRKNIAGGRFRENQAKSRRKMLERLERVEPPRAVKTIHFSISVEEPSGARVLELQDLIVGFRSVEGETTLFVCPDALIERGERVALIGPNGCGKTTFLRVLAGEIPPLSGSITPGHNVKSSYFRQIHWEELDARQRVLDALLSHKHQTISEARDFLGQFLFSGDDVFKRIDELSGGERSRVALARLAQLGGNFLLLDEPTNHLDLPSREVLQAALQRYEGTVLFVSHDRYLIRALATQIWEVREGRCHVYKGDYEYYLRKRTEEITTLSSTDKAAGSSRSRRRDRAREERASRHGQTARRQLEAREAELTHALTSIEEDVARLERELESASYAGDPERIREASRAYQQKKTELEEIYREWNAVVEELEHRQSAPS